MMMVFIEKNIPIIKYEKGYPLSQANLRLLTNRIKWKIIDSKKESFSSSILGQAF